MQNIIIGLIMTISASLEACLGMTSDINRTDFQSVNSQLVQSVDVTENNSLPFLVGNSLAKELIGKEIFFPPHWEQMPDEVIAPWCCAGSKDKSITEKYLAMFGLKKWNGEYLKFGTNENGVACRIIDFGSLKDDNPEDNRFKSDFLKSFRQMTSNLGGRVSLYRTFIEILRTDEFGQGTLGQDVKEITTAHKLAGLTKDRNKFRHIEIQRSDRNFLSLKERFMGFSPSGDQRTANAVGHSHWGKADISQESRTDDVGLNHEITHWFHILRHPERAFKEMSLEIERQNISKTFVGREKADWWFFEDEETDKIFVNMEEYRTIIGGNENVVFKTFLKTKTLYPKQEKPMIFHGDNLCENFYRYCSEQKIRYGHVQADSGTIKKQTVDECMKKYEESFKIFKNIS